MSEKKRRRHSPRQIVEQLKEADRLLNAGQPVGQVIQALGISEATYHTRTIAGGTSTVPPRLRYGPPSDKISYPYTDSHSGWYIVFRQANR